MSASLRFAILRASWSLMASSTASAIDGGAQSDPQRLAHGLAAIDLVRRSRERAQAGAEPVVPLRHPVHGVQRAVQVERASFEVCGFESSSGVCEAQTRMSRATRGRAASRGRGGRARTERAARAGVRRARRARWLQVVNGMGGRHRGQARVAKGGGDDWAPLPFRVSREKGSRRTTPRRGVRGTRGGYARAVANRHRARKGRRTSGGHGEHVVCVRAAVETRAMCARECSSLALKKRFPNQLFRRYGRGDQ